jgi:hypothetical protein
MDVYSVPIVQAASGVILATIRPILHAPVARPLCPFVINVSTRLFALSVIPLFI